MNKLNKAYKALLKEFDKRRKEMSILNYGLCWLRKKLPDRMSSILQKDFYLEGLRSHKYHWKFSKASYDARRRWIERRIKETENE